MSKLVILQNAYVNYLSLLTKSLLIYSKSIFKNEKSSYVVNIGAW